MDARAKLSDARQDQSSNREQYIQNVAGIVICKMDQPVIVHRIPIRILPTTVQGTPITTNA